MGYPSFSVNEVLTSSDMNAVGLWRITGCTVTSVGGTAATASNGVITIGTNNTSVTVSSAFSSDYLNYRILIVGGTGSTQSNLQMQLSGITTSVYNQLGYYQIWGASTRYDYAAGSTSVIVGDVSATAYSCDVEIKNPFASVRKFGNTNSQSSNNQYAMPFYINSTASATGFTLTPGAGNLTGGTIRVYGYRN